MSIPTRRGECTTNGEIYRLIDFLGPSRIDHRDNPSDEDASLTPGRATIMSLADMTKDLKRSIIVIVSLIAFEKIITVEDNDDLALAKINKLFRHHPQMITLEYESWTSKHCSDETQLESKLSDLLEFHQRGPSKLPKACQDNEENEYTPVFSSELSPLMRFVRGHRIILVPKMKEDQQTHIKMRQKIIIKSFYPHSKYHRYSIFQNCKYLSCKLPQN